MHDLGDSSREFSFLFDTFHDEFSLEVLGNADADDDSIAERTSDSTLYDAVRNRSNT